MSARDLFNKLGILGVTKTTRVSNIIMHAEWVSLFFVMEVFP